MNIQNRLTKLENGIQRKDTSPNIVWDFSATTTAQLLELEDLLTSGDEEKASAYTRRLIGEGFLSYRIIN